eukprot:TRINITY_DN6037_c0_g1_i5.p1 TRINITY_DN6037_c0_g1~~TRINITY_DN6037_c0_g1_i5.p1  ORF type:complete len:434 (+),score=70.88 TRINITY_DN6037_c0_g1_i5:2258-3559(+)
MSHPSMETTSVASQPEEQPPQTELLAPTDVTPIDFQLMLIEKHKSLGTTIQQIGHEAAYHLPQYFGIEIDCITYEPRTRASIAQELSSHPFNFDPSAGNQMHQGTKLQFRPTSYNDRSHGSWKVKPDYQNLSSKSGEKVKSFQIVSPILTTDPSQGASPVTALQTIDVVVRMLKDIGVYTDPSCGFHFHIDISTLDTAQLRQFVRRYLHSMRDINSTLIPMDRFTASPEGLFLPDATEDEIDDSTSLTDLVQLVNPGTVGRFASLNLTNLLNRPPFRQETAEFRSHHAILDTTAIVSWGALCNSITCDEPVGNHPISYLSTLPESVQYYFARRASDLRLLHTQYAANLLGGGSSQLAKHQPSQMLSYQHGPRDIITPRQAALKRAFPLQTSGDLLKSVDNDVQISGGEAGSGINPNRSYIPDDPFDPLPPMDK